MRDFIAAREARDITDAADVSKQLQILYFDIKDEAAKGNNHVKLSFYRYGERISELVLNQIIYDMLNKRFNVIINDKDDVTISW